MAKRRSLTLASLQVLQALLVAEKADEPLHGYALLKATGLRSGTLYPILVRLRDQGWLVGAQDPEDLHRPPRTYYRLTAEGEEQARSALIRLSA